MKEHSLFLQAGFMPKNTEYIQEAMLYKRQFERLLADVVILGDCMVSQNVLDSGEIVTNFTFGAERKTEELTGIMIDSNITLQELRLQSGDYFMIEARNMTDATIQSVTNKTIEETKKYIDFKTAGTEGIKDCKI